MIEDQSMTPTTEYLYFLIGLSRRGESIKFDTFLPSPYHIAYYIDMYYEADIEKVGSQVPIQKIENISLKVVLYMIG